VKDWWLRPGIGIMYQIEYRPGWRWMRNFNKFNASLMDEKGNFKFNGPYCKISEWVELSKRVGVDYHIFEAKWHDGIVWFNTSLTEWKSPTDYAKEFAELSRKAEIPFMFYYSSVIDHNPQFHKLIPLNTITPSFPKMGRSDVYKNYLVAQVRELIDQYDPDGLWFDWYLGGLHPSETVVAEFLREYSPDTVFTFNLTNPFKVGYWHAFRNLHVLLIVGFIHYLLFEKKERKKDALDLVHYTTFEAHRVKGAWRKSNIYSKFTPTWELVGPAGKAWDNVKLRRDLYDLVRIAAMVMANGGRYVIGAAPQMDGSIYPDHVKQLELLGEWYKPRKNIFRDGVPMDYHGKVPGIRGYDEKIYVSASRSKSNYLIHLFNLGVNSDVTLQFDKKFWPKIDEIYVEPQHERVQAEDLRTETKVTIPREHLDPVDTILSIAGVPGSMFLSATTATSHNTAIRWKRWVK